MAATLDVSTTRFAAPARAAARSTRSVPFTAGSTRSFCGSLTVITYGLAMCST